MKDQWIFERLKTIWGHQQGPEVSKLFGATSKVLRFHGEGMQTHGIRKGKKGGEGVEHGCEKTVNKCRIKGDLYVPKGCWAAAVRQWDNSYPLLWKNLLSGL